METVRIQIRSKRAYSLLENLESLHIIKILKKEEHSGQKLSEKYAGKLPSDIAEKLQSYVAKSREEWSERNI